MVLKEDSKVLDLNAHMDILTRAFAVHIHPEIHMHMAPSNFNSRHHVTWSVPIDTAQKKIYRRADQYIDKVLIKSAEDVQEGPESQNIAYM